MAYYGTNDDREQADEIHASYVEKMKCFTRWLVDNGRKVRLFVGDSSGTTASCRRSWPTCGNTGPISSRRRVVAEPVTSFAELTRAMAPVGTVVATRYHNVMCALKLAKPTISIGYAAKNVAVMADAGLSEFCQSANSLDVDLLIEQFTELESRSAQLRQNDQGAQRGERAASRPAVRGAVRAALPRQPEHGTTTGHEGRARGSAETIPGGPRT